MLLTPPDISHLSATIRLRAGTTSDVGNCDLIAMHLATQSCTAARF
jgi:hypothetical protein